jgi:membrane protein implicated in regulation of membrane protease activity
MPVERLFTWWNAVYTLPLAAVLLVLAITSIIGLIGGALGEVFQSDHHDVDHDVDVDHDLDLDHDVDVDHDLDVDADADVHAHHAGCGHGHGGADHGFLLDFLVALGVGRAPLMLVLQMLVLLWGVVGLGLHQTFGAAGPGALLWSLPATLAISLLGTRAFALLFGRFFKQKESYALQRNEMAGRTGRVVFAVTAEEGTVHVRDQHGTLHRLRARCPEGRLESGQEIIVLGYDPDRKVYEVDDPRLFVERP